MNEQEIIQRVKLNDEKAFEQLIDHYKPVIERFAYQFGIKQENISDIVQETFIKIYRKIHLYTKGKFSTWLYKITLNVTRDYYRKEKRSTKLMDRAKERQQGMHARGYYFEKQEHLFLHECIQKLDAKYKLPLILYYFHDKTYDEIALILNIKLSMVKTRIYRGKRKVKELYESTIGEEVYQNG
ncbi:RNA polymerase sigma factor [Oceanobacillus saliphilus]|uniref:RNA polymerase sigma factor n=1 Tax=Oceanobacillus saliphilus TaxID=2925834 RepID=UPI00201DA40B|nr:RNA polymerase sigma factor [Oceanobacillus saliphilus]